MLRHPAAPWACLLAGLGHAVLLYGLASGSRNAPAAGSRAIAGTATATARAVTVRLVAEASATPAPPVLQVAQERANGKAAEAAEPAEEDSPTLPCGSAHYRDPSAVDRSALPRSAPDESLLDGTTPSGLPIRLRLCISEAGEVVQVQPLLVSDADGEVMQRLEAMFRATGFVAARQGGADVASRMEIEIGFNRTP